MLVGALIFVLGIDLVKEALWDTRNRVNKTEYLTIVSIMITMTVWDFVFGVLFGIIASCELAYKLDVHKLHPMPLRFLLCCPEFSAEQHPRASYRRDGDVDRSATQCSPSLPT